jgi:hypothetical protein
MQPRNVTGDIKVKLQYRWAELSNRICIVYFTPRQNLENELKDPRHPLEKHIHIHHIH